MQNEFEVEITVQLCAVVLWSVIATLCEIHNKLLELHSYFPLIVNNKPQHACCGGAPFSVVALSTCLVCLWVNPPLIQWVTKLLREPGLE